MSYSGNTLITPTIVAGAALDILRNRCVYKDLVHTDYSSEFVNAIGDTVNVRVPATLTAYDFSTSITTQNTTESYIPVKLDRFKDVSCVITSKEWSLSIKDFNAQIIQPAMAALGEAVDGDVANYIFGNAGNTVTRTALSPTNLANIADLGKALDIAKAAKQNRSLVFSPHHKYVYALTDNLSKAAYAGDNMALRDADLGRLYGFETFMDQNTPTSTATTSGTATGTITVASSSDSGEVDLTAGSAATATFAKGDGFVYNGVLYRFTEAVTLSSSAASSKTVSPSFPSGVSATACYVVRNGSSLAFHKDAVAFVNRPLAVPQGAAKAAVASADGLSVRVVFDYDSTHKYDIISFDILYGLKVLRSTLAARLVDGTLS